ncbi:MAG: hypothetical protein IKT40_01220 [Bacilli bacterium]|nr:hypothetical protein [Bacilli bacterium]
MIKVGQIYKTESNSRYIVTYMGTYNIYLLYDNGYCMEYSISSMNNNYDDKLIAEYPTWQEAVNSPEFKGEK